MARGEKSDYQRRAKTARDIGGGAERQAGMRAEAAARQAAAQAEAAAIAAYNESVAKAAAEAKYGTATLPPANIGTQSTAALTGAGTAPQPQRSTAAYTGAGTAVAGAISKGFDIPIVKITGGASYTSPRSPANIGTRSTAAVTGAGAAKPKTTTTTTTKPTPVLDTKGTVATTKPTTTRPTTTRPTPTRVTEPPKGWVDYPDKPSGWIDYPDKPSGWVDYPDRPGGWIDYPKPGGGGKGTTTAKKQPEWASALLAHWNI